jgi:hypothetical protein
MLQSRLDLVVLLAWVLSDVPVQSFIQPAALAPRRPTAHLYADNGQEVLTFSGNFELTSDHLPGATEDVASFFKSKECRNLLLSAGGTRPLAEVKVTPQLKEMWTEMCGFFGSTNLPNDDDYVLICETTINFPGVCVRNKVYNGVKLLESENGLPEYELILVADKRSAEGPAPLVWLFNKLTGVKEDDDAEFSPPQGRVKNRVSIVKLEDGDLAVNVDVKFQIVIKFPTILVRLLPVSKEKMEENGTASVLKAISKDIMASVEGTREAFLNKLHA